MHHANFYVWPKLEGGGKILIFVYFDSSWKTRQPVAIVIVYLYIVVTLLVHSR